MSSDYLSIEDSLRDILTTIKAMLELLNISHDLLVKADDAAEFVRSKRYRVAVVGAFKTGKSSLINALLGTPHLLPEDIIPATATINRIVFGKTKSATAFFHDGTNEEIPIDELAKYVAKTTPDGAYQASLIKEVVLSMPTVICQNHVEIIDTPGLNDDKKMTAITLRALEEVDGVIVTISQQFPFDDTTADFVYRMIKKESITNIVFVVTHVDQLYETLEDEGGTYDEYMEFLKNRINEIVFKKLKGEEEYFEKAHRLLDGDKIHLLGISSYLYFQYLITNNYEQLEKSLFQTFKEKLIPIITVQQIENSIFKTKVNVEKIINECNLLKNEKIKFFETKINQCIESVNLLESYKNSERSKRIFNDVFNSEYSEYDSCLVFMNKEKNRIAKEFIGTLSTIKRNQENDEIRRMIINKFTEMEHKENTTFLNDLWNQIHSINNTIFQTYSDKKKEDLLDVFNLVGSEVIDPNSDIETFLVNYIDPKVAFQWEYCPITKNVDCLHTDLLDLIVEAIDCSIENLKKRFSNFISKEIQSTVLSIIQDRHIQVYANLQNRLNDEKKKTIKEQTAFEYNFQEFAKKIPELREKVESFSKNI